MEIRRLVKINNNNSFFEIKQPPIPHMGLGVVFLTLSPWV